VEQCCLFMDDEASSRLFNALLDYYKRALYEYNNEAKRFGFYLKPVHIVVKNTLRGRMVYNYYGRYWYKLAKSNGKIKWIYVGVTKPIKELPEPPLNPLLLISTALTNNPNHKTICVISPATLFCQIIRKIESKFFNEVFAKCCNQNKYRRANSKGESR